MRAEAPSLSRPIGRVLSSALVKCTETYAGAGLVWGTSNCPTILEAVKQSPEGEPRPKTGKEAVAGVETAAQRPSQARQKSAV
jgi:hypothetical protein